MSVLDFIRKIITPDPVDVTSPDEKRRIEEQQREVRARLRMLKLEADVMTRRRVDELRRDTP